MNKNIGSTLTLISTNEFTRGRAVFSAHFVYMCTEDQHPKNFQDVSWVTEHVGWNLSSLTVLGSFDTERVSRPIEPESIIFTEIEYKHPLPVDLQRAKDYLSTLRRIDNRITKHRPINYYHQYVLRVSEAVGSRAVLVCVGGNPNSYRHARYEWYRLDEKNVRDAIRKLTDKY